MRVVGVDKQLAARIDSTMKKFIDGHFKRTKEQIEASKIAESTPCEYCGRIVLAGRCCNRNGEGD